MTLLILIGFGVFYVAVVVFGFALFRGSALRDRAARAAFEDEMRKRRRSA